MKKQFITLAHILILLSFLGMVMTLHFEGVKGFSVEGPITSDTVWTLGDSPIEVLGDVIIDNGASLSIEPGVEIIVETGLSLTVVNGSLDAVGTSDNRIRFTSGRNEPTAGDWDGMKFYGDENSTLTISFCDVEYAKDGIAIASAGKALIEKSTIIHNSANGIHAAGVTNLLIRENTVKLNANGISASGANSSGLEVIDNSILNNKNGVYISVYGDDSYIRNITISGNSLRDNTNGIYLHSSSRPISTASTYIHNVTISDNSIQSIRYGIHLLAKGWGEPGLQGGGAYIYNSIVSQNNISFSQHALYVDSSSNWYSWISGLAISGNIIHSSENGIFMHAFRTPKPPLYPGIPFDVVLVSNVISTNGKGVSIFGDVRANFTSNSVSYNSYGIHLDSLVPSESVARNNDIYRNTAYGILVVENVSINAEHNYWGASSGPYHETLNPSGEGDRVNGDGENLDFTNFLTEPFGVINDPPFAVIKADKITVAANQTVTFDGSESSDDSSILKHFFDFGDGEAMQVFSGVVRHEYASPGSYNVNLVVMDDLGVNSTNEAVEAIIVTAKVSLVVSVFLSPLSVVSEGQATVGVHVEVQAGDEVESIEGAFVELASDQGGSFEPSSGHTNSTGDLESTFFVLEVSESTFFGITATASKEGYEKGSADASLQVLTPPSDVIESDYRGIWLVAIMITVIVTVFILLRKGKLQKLMHG